jgi:hypothetical protein
MQTRPATPSLDVRWIIAAAILLGLAFGLTQAILPRVGENRVKDRLTRDGGTASVSITAIPAIRLLFDDGDKLEVRARRLAIPVKDLRGGSFKEMDGFDEVDVRITNSRVGPFSAERIVLERGEDEDLYGFAFRGSTSAGQLADFALGTLPPALSSLIEAIGGRPASQPIPIRLEADLLSTKGGTARLQRGTGTVAGIPLGGLSLTIAGAIIARITG